MSNLACQYRERVVLEERRDWMVILDYRYIYTLDFYHTQFCTMQGATGLRGTKGNIGDRGRMVRCSLYSISITG